MVKFTDEHKKERSTNYFDEGIHPVLIESLEFGTTEKQQEYAEFNVIDVDDPDRKGQARVWFTSDAAINFSLNILRGIAVHNAKTDADKEKVKAAFAKLGDTSELAKMADRFRGMEAWYVVEKSDRTYTNDAGEIKPSYNRNVLGYEPKPKAPSVVDQVVETTGGEQVDINPDEFPF